MREEHATRPRRATPCDVAGEPEQCQRIAVASRSPDRDERVRDRLRRGPLGDAQHVIGAPQQLRRPLAQMLDRRDDIAACEPALDLGRPRGGLHATRDDAHGRHGLRAFDQRRTEARRRHVGLAHDRERERGIRQPVGEFERVQPLADAFP